MASSFRSTSTVNTGSLSISEGDLILTGNIYFKNRSGGGAEEVVFQTEQTLSITGQNNIVFKVDSDNDTGNAGVIISDASDNTQFYFFKDGRAIFNQQQNASGLFAIRSTSDLGSVLVNYITDQVGLGLETNTFTQTGIGSDVKVLLSGAAGSINTSTRGTTLNAGDLVVSGTSNFKNNLILTGNIYIKSEDEDGFNIGAENDFKISANGNVKILVDSDDDNSNGFFSTEGIAGTNFVSYEHGQNIFNFDRQADGDFFVRGSSGYSLLHVDAGENAVAIGDPATNPFVRTGVGTDVKTSIFGTAGTKDGATRGVTLIQGDAVVSGSTHLQNNLHLTGALYMSNPSGDDIIFNSETEFLLTAQNNVTIKVDSDGDSSNSGFKINDSSNTTQAYFYEDGRAIFNFSQNSPGSWAVRGSTDFGLILADLSNNIVGLGAYTNVISSLPGLGTDVKVLLSGSTSSKDSATRGVTLVAGDMVTSGSSYMYDDLNLSVNKAIYFNNPGGTADQYIKSVADVFLDIEADDYLRIYADESIDMNVNDGSTSSRFEMGPKNIWFNRTTSTTSDTSLNNNLLFVSGGVGSVSLGGTSYPNYGTDVKLYLSGTAGTKDSATRGTTLIAGDVVISGSTYLEGDTYFYESNLQIDPNYAIHFDGATTGNGPLIRGNTVALTVDGDNRLSLRFDNDLYMLDSTESNIPFHVIDSSDTSEYSNVGGDVAILLSGSANSKDVTSSRGVTLVSGDMVVSGTIYGGSSNLTLEGDYDVVIKASDALEVQNGGGAIMHILGSTKTVFNQSRFNALNFQVNTDNQYGTLFIDSGDETVVLGAEGLTQVPDIATELPSYGSDVKLYLSGTAGSKDSSTRGVTLLTGDLVVSGNIYQKNNSVIKDITRGAARINVSNLNEYYLANGDAAQTSIGSGYTNLYVTPFSGSFNKLTLRSSTNTAFDGIGGLTASLYIAGPDQDGSSITSNAFSKEIIRLDAGSVERFNNISFDFTGSSFDPTDVYAIGLKPDNNWNTNASCDFNWVSFSSYFVD